MKHWPRLNKRLRNFGVRLLTLNRRLQAVKVGGAVSPAMPDWLLTVANQEDGDRRGAVHTINLT